MITSEDDCVGYARDCERLARMATDPEARERLFQMAREWMAIAMHEATTPERKLAS
jgi:hypothetical protein